MPAAAEVAETSPTQRLLFCANLCVDNVLEVESFPKEDTSQRAAASRKAVGGNGANSGRVLAQLRGQRCRISLLAAVPRRDEADTAFALAALEGAGVDTELVEEVGGEALPASFVVSSRDTGARTVISSRCGVGELTLRHFADVARRVFADAATHGAPCWCHFECRQPPAAILEMARAWRAAAGALPSPPPLSLELEKPKDLEELRPLLQLCEHVVVDQAFAELQLGGTHLAEALRAEDEQHPALRFLRALRRFVGAMPGGLRPCWVCTWGKHGCFAIEAASGETFFQPAFFQEKVVDTIGAGDSFIGSYLHARLAGAGTQDALRCGAAVAGRKVSQVGFAGLRAALPAGLE